MERNSKKKRGNCIGCSHRIYMSGNCVLIDILGSNCRFTPLFQPPEKKEKEQLIQAKGAD